MLRGWVLLTVPVFALGAVPDFERDIRPILTANCAQCHSEKLKTSGFSIASMESVLRGGNKYGPAVLAGDPMASPMVKMLKGQLTPRMPFGKTLAERDLAAIEDWIHTLKPAQHEPPAVKDAAWVANPIDAFILRKLEEKGLRPAPPAARRVLARRVYF